MNTQHIISIQNLLRNRGVDFDSQKVKFVRHKNSSGIIRIKEIEYHETLYHLYRTQPDVFCIYQNEQDTATFKEVDYIISFIGEENSMARFIGVFKNYGRKDLDGGRSLFDFQKVSGFEVLEEKVIIDWGGSAISWNQWWKNDKYVVRIDRGLSEGDIPVFRSYEDVVLSYTQLKAIIDKNDTEWRTKLEAVNCIYLILDKNTGKQYVGSTYRGSKSSGAGIWGRWKEYVVTGGNGNDVSLKELCTDDNLYPTKFFQWCILEILPLNVDATVAIERESLYKEKFGTRKYGYNNN